MRPKHGILRSFSFTSARIICELAPPPEHVALTRFYAQIKTTLDEQKALSALGFIRCPHGFTHSHPICIYTPSVTASAADYHQAPCDKLMRKKRTSLYSGMMQDSRPTMIKRETNGQSIYMRAYECNSGLESVIRSNYCKSRSALPQHLPQVTD